MSLVPFLAVAFGAAAAALVARGYRRLSLAIGLLGLIAATIAALAIVPGDRLGVGPGRLEATEFGRLFLALGCSTGLVIALIGLATAWQRNLPAALLGGFGAIGLALAIGDSITALMAILAGALVGSLVTIVRPITASNVQVASREFRAIAVAGAIAIVGMAWIARPLGPLAEEPTVFGVAYMAVALAAAIRFGAIPFHRWAARLSESAPEIALPLLLAWAPAAFAVVALAWTDRSIAPLLLPLQVERSVVLTVGVLSIVLGAVAAWLQDDLEHIVGYSIVQDAGFVILGLAILDPIAWQPTRTWILVFVVVKTAFAAWAVAVRTRFRTGSLPELGGWARRSPGLGLGLLLIVIATLGVPGLVAWEVRSRLVDLSITTGPLRLLVIFGGARVLRPDRARRPAAAVDPRPGRGDRATAPRRHRRRIRRQRAGDRRRRDGGDGSRVDRYDRLDRFRRCRARVIRRPRSSSTTRSLESEAGWRGADSVRVDGRIDLAGEPRSDRFGRRARPGVDRARGRGRRAGWTGGCGRAGARAGRSDRDIRAGPDRAGVAGPVRKPRAGRERRTVICPDPDRIDRRVGIARRVGPADRGRLPVLGRHADAITDDDVGAESVVEPRADPVAELSQGDARQSSGARAQRSMSRS